MKRAIGLAMVFALASMASPPAQAAGTQTTNYVAAAAVANGSTLTVAGNRISPLGGFAFTPDTASFRLTFADLGAGGNPIAVSVCQTIYENESDPPHLCGDGPLDKEIKQGCTTAGNAVSRVDVTGGASNNSGTFVIGKSIGVFIFVDPVTCPNAATAGTATVVWPKP